MAATVSRAPLAVAVGIALAIGTLAPPARASVLCKNRRGGLLVRDTCKPREQTLDPPSLDALGLRGPAGPVGPVGPPGGGLKVLDAADAEVGLVTGLQTYYGQHASLVRQMTLPGGLGPEFVAFSVTTQGLSTSDYACNGYYGTYYTNPDCTGDPFEQCDYGSCSSVQGAFLFTSVAVRTDGIGCFARGGSEFRRGDFFHQTEVSGLSIDDVTSKCVGAGGTFLGPVTSCGIPQFPRFCVQCCALAHDVGVAPVHEVDMSGVGTPPFRLSR